MDDEEIVQMTQKLVPLLDTDGAARVIAAMIHQRTMSDFGDALYRTAKAVKNGY